MREKMRGLGWFGIAALVVVFSLQLGLAQVTPPSTQQTTRLGGGQATPLYTQSITPYLERYHPAVGSWIGIAVQVCPSGVAPSACSPFGPAVSLLMVPNLTADGNIVAGDTLELMGPPFGPHTSAHGKWIPTSPTEVIADYVFVVQAVPPDLTTPSFNGFRARWLAQWTSPDDLVGWVNGYLVPGVPATWQSLTADAYPEYPKEGLALVTSPTVFYKNPSECTGQGCPLVFKFRLKRVSP